jgi:hypothetical protein
MSIITKMKKKGQFALAISLIMSLVVVGILLVVLFRINAATAAGHGNVTTDTTGIINSSMYISDAGDQIGSNLSLIAIITIFAIIIGLLTTYFIGRAMTNV